MRSRFHRSHVVLSFLCNICMACRLHSSLESGVRIEQPWLYSLSGTFNEQALSNLVYAYDKAGLLDSTLLQAVLNVGALRLRTGGANSDYIHGNGHSSNMPRSLVFKPQEMCTLLKACQNGMAEPWEFLSELAAVLDENPMITSAWSGPEAAELSRAMTLLRTHNQRRKNAQVRAATHSEWFPF